MWWNELEVIMAEGEFEQAAHAQLFLPGPPLQVSNGVAMVVPAMRPLGDRSVTWVWVRSR